MTLEYKQSLKEVDIILNVMGKEYINKLPAKLISFIKKNMDNSYISNINVNIPINEQMLKNDTRSLLSLIYRNYWCDEEKKKELLTEDAYLKSERERKIREKYNPDNIFKNKQQNIINEESLENGTSIVEYKESSIFRRIINKIKYIFRVWMKD